MKKIFMAACILVISLSVLLSGCSAKNAYPSYEYDKADGASEEYYSSGSSTQNDVSAPQASPGEAAEMGKGGLTGLTLDTQGITLAEKMIYTARVAVETLDFDGALRTLREMITANGAFLESSSVSGNSYYNSYYTDTSSRYANYTIRVPVDRYEAMLDGMSSLGYVTESGTDSQNITAQYTDVEARLTALRTEESRLLELLKKAETVEDIIAIERRLSEVGYEIESLTSTLRNYDNRVDYSTIYLSIQEVAQIKEIQSIQRTYSQRITTAFRDSVKWVYRAIENLGVFVVSALPVIAIPVVILAVVFIALRIQSRRRRARAELNKSKEAGAGIPEQTQKPDHKENS